MKRLLLILLFSITGMLLCAQPAIQWQKCLGGTDNDYANSVQQTTDGGYIAAGYTRSDNGNVSGNHGDSDFWVVKLDSSGNLMWQKCLGGTAAEQANSIQQTSDGGYIVAGYTLSDNGDVSGNHGNEDCWIVKLDGNGFIQWQKCLGGSERDYANAVRQTSDGGYIIAGYTFSNDGDVSGNLGNDDYWVVKLDVNGNIQWQKCFGGTESEYANDIQETGNGSYIVAGYTYSNNGDVSGNNGSYDSWIIEINNTGILQWQKCLGGTSSEFTYSLQQTTSGNIIVAGSTGSNNGDVNGNHNTTGIGFEWDQWIVLLNGSGNLLWQKCLGGTDQDIAFSIQQTIDGGFVVGGNAWSTTGNVTGNHGSSDFWLVKLDINGNILWQQCLGGSSFEMARSMQQTIDGGFIMAGFTLSNNGDVIGNHGNYDAWIVKLLPVSTPLPIELVAFTGEATADSNILRWTTASEINNDYFTLLKSNSGYNFQIIGNVNGAGNSVQTLNYSFTDTKSFAGINYYLLQQTDYNGQTSFSKIITVNNSLENINPINVFPNPVYDIIELDIKGTFADYEIEIINNVGQSILKTRNQNKIDVSQLPEGVYYLKVNDILFTQKFIRKIIR